MFGTTISPITTTAPPPTVAPSAFQNALQNINNVLTNVVQPAANIYTQVKQPGQSQASPTSPVYTPGAIAPGTTQPAAQPNTMKYVVIGGVVVLAVTGLYFATRKKKGK